jgi:hypothetical protein
MKMAAFNAVCPYEIGDKVKIIEAVKGSDGQLFTSRVATITDIACTHYIKSRKIVFTYELDNGGEYAPLVSLKEER